MINLGRASCVSGSRCSLCPSTLTELFQNLDLRELPWCKVLLLYVFPAMASWCPIAHNGRRSCGGGGCRWSIVRFYLCSNSLCLFGQFGITVYHVLLTPALNELGEQCGPELIQIGSNTSPIQAQALSWGVRIWESPRSLSLLWWTPLTSQWGSYRPAVGSHQFLRSASACWTHLSFGTEQTACGMLGGPSSVHGLVSQLPRILERTEGNATPVFAGITIMQAVHGIWEDPLLKEVQIWAMELKLVSPIAYS